MDNNLKALLSKRKEAGACIICGALISDSKSQKITLSHSVLGDVIICQKHIRVQGE